MFTSTTALQWIKNLLTSEERLDILPFLSSITQKGAAEDISILRL